MSVEENKRKEQSNTELELGDIIQIKAPNNSELHDKIVFIDYVDSSVLKLIDGNTLDTIELNIEDGRFSDESIESISILNKSKEKGYSKQNNLLPETWIDLHFGGDVPTIITGQITNLEEDMIEIKTFPDNETIYIDFAYKGIPLHIPINQIVIREEPLLVKQEQEEQQELLESQEQEEEEQKEISEPLEPQEGEEVISKSVEEENDANILEANSIVFGEELGEIKQIVNVDESQKRFSLETQLNDLLDDLLSVIPSYKRNKTTMQNIHTLIQRFKELRETYSQVDNYGNTNMKLLKGEKYVPLIQAYEKLNKNLTWILPVVKNKRAIYFKDLDEEEEANKNSVEDIETYVISDSIKQEVDLIKRYEENQSVGENKYDNLYKQLNTFYTPYDLPNERENLLLLKQVENNLHVVVNSLENIESSVFNIKNKEIISPKRFVIEKYNLGLTRLATKQKSSKFLVDIVPLTESDSLPLESIMTLPLPFIQYSHIHLPKTSLYKKSNLNQVNMNYWSELRKKTNVVSKVVYLNDNLDHSGFLKNIQNFTLDSASTADLSQEEKYKLFLEKVFPSTKKIIELLEPQLRNIVSYNKLIEQLEPFLVYNEEITEEQNKKIKETIEQNIENYFNELDKKEHSYNYLKNKLNDNEYNGSNIYDFVKDSPELVETYNINENQTSSEIVKNILQIDRGRLFNSFLSEKQTGLFSFSDVAKTVEDELARLKDVVEEEKKQDTCKNYVLSKKYIEIDELEDDNNKDIYFDKKYDPTQYDIIKEYPQHELTKEEYILFVTTKLQETIGLSEENAKYDAESMIEGKRKVKEGQYALLEQYKDNKPDFKYYKRIGQTWVYDEAVTKDTFTQNSNTFCNIQESCLEINKDCLQDNSSIEKEKLMSEIVKNFESDFLISQEELKRDVKRQFEYAKKVIKKIKAIETYTRLKYDYLKHKLGTLVEQKDVVNSPYQNKLNLILGHGDFVEKQEYIIQFANEHTREATPTEDPYFRYCVDTGINMFPTFLLELAEAFQSGNYVNALDRICKERGQLSDDGDAWVDKHSGLFIKQVDSSSDEGYDAQGFKVQTKFAVQENVLFQKQIKKKLSENEKKILNVIESVMRNMGIQGKVNKQFIVNRVISYIEKKIGTKEAYKKAAKEKEKKGKKVPKYETALNTDLLYVTISYLIIEIQTSIPSLKSTKTFPGCIRSLHGYPLGSINDLLMVKYVSCILDKMKTEVQPWKNIKKLNAEKIEKNLLIFIKNTLKDEDIKKKIQEKRTYLEKEPELQEESIPTELTIQHWKTFLPPLQKLNTTSVQGISPEFKKLLEEHIVKGEKTQESKLLTLVSKVMYSSLYIQTTIENIVKHESLLLKTNNDIPFLQNACCNLGSINTIQYFNEKQNSILEVNEKAYKLMKMFYDYQHLSKALYLESNKDTKLKYPPLGTDFSEDTIYRAFIQYCRFNQEINLDEALLKICATPTSGFLKTDSIEQKIKTLKNEGKNYNQEDLKLLLDIVQRRNRVNVNLDIITVSKREQLNDVLDNILSSNPQETLSTFSRLLKEVIQSNEKEYNDKVDILRNFLLEETQTKLKPKLLEFVKENKGRQNTKQFEEFIKNISTWIKLDNEPTISGKQLETFKLTEFLKQAIEDVNIIYPTIILHKHIVNSKISKHLKLSELHQSDLTKIIKEEYEPLQKFYNEEEQEEQEEQESRNNQINQTLIFITNINKPINKIIDYLPIFDSVLSKNIYEYLLLLSLTNYLELLQQREDHMEEIELTEKRVLVTKLLLTYVELLLQRKNKILIWNKETIYAKVYKEKEEEKSAFTRRFEVLSDEERRLEDTNKNLKLGKYAKGLGKSVLEYSGETYDEERGELRERAQLLDVDQHEAEDMSFIQDEGEMDSYDEY